MKQINARVSEELHRAARIKALKTGKSLTQVINELLQDWVEENDEQKNENSHNHRRHP